MTLVLYSVLAGFIYIWSKNNNVENCLQHIHSEVSTPVQGNIISLVRLFQDIAAFSVVGRRKR